MNEISHLKKILTILNLEDMFRVVRIHHHKTFDGYRVSEKCFPNLECIFFKYVNGFATIMSHGTGGLNLFAHSV